MKISVWKHFFQKLIKSYDMIPSLNTLTYHKAASSKLQRSVRVLPNVQISSELAKHDLNNLK